MHWRSGLMGIALAALISCMGTAAARASQVLTACCLPSTACIDATDADCTGQGGTAQTGLTCDAADCGACCEVGQQGLQCTLALATNCTTAQGRAFGGAGTDCTAGCPFCCTCTGDANCSQPCEENPIQGFCSLCPPSCVAAVNVFETCAGGCESTGCCQLDRGEDSNLCMNMNEGACALSGGTFHPGDECKEFSGICGPKFCCRCEGNPQTCGDGACRDDCQDLLCPPTVCTQVVTTTTCADGCQPTGCCSIPVGAEDQLCIASDAAACEFGKGSFVPGGVCDPATGQCGGPTPTATATASTTPTSTATRTVTATPVPTSTRIPEGGSCTDSSQCAAALLCIDNVCTAVHAPAPTVSRFGLLLAVATLIAIAAVSLRRSLRRR